MLFWVWLGRCFWRRSASESADGVKQTVLCSLGRTHEPIKRLKTICPSTEEWIKRTWYINTMEYYSGRNRNETGSFFRDMDGPRDCYTE